VPVTPRLHFDEDMARARAMLESADLDDRIPEGVKADMLRCSWMLGVGALDAYFSDAYAALLACTLIALRRQPNHRLTGSPIGLPDAIAATPLPASIHFRKYQARDNWRWRMAARELIEKQNYLNVDRICSVLNQYVRPSRKVLKGVLADWLQHPDANMTLFSVSRSAYGTASLSEKKTHRAESTKKLRDRMDRIIGRRHDCIHNCDRPKMALKAISAGTTRFVLRDIEFFVHRCDEHMDVEFPAFLMDLGFSKTTWAHLTF